MRLQNTTLDGRPWYRSQLVGSTHNTQPGNPLRIEFSVTDSRLEARDRTVTLGRVAGVSLVGVLEQNTHLDMRIATSEFKAERASASLVGEIVRGNLIDLSMNDSNITSSVRQDQAQIRNSGRLTAFAAPVADMQKNVSNNRVLLHHCLRNRVTAKVEAGTSSHWHASASLGWGIGLARYVGNDGWGNNTWEQRELEGNIVRAEVAGAGTSHTSRSTAAMGPSGSARASLAGQFWYRGFLRASR